MRADLDKADGTASVRRHSGVDALSNPPWPCLHRESIRWSGGACWCDLVIELTFDNSSAVPTRPLCAIVQVAEFGAFVPWHPLTALRVPAIAPHGRITVSTVVDPNESRDLHLDGFGTPGSSQHFAGNLNVFVPGGLVAERHWRRIRLVEEPLHVASFHVGDGHADDYTLSFECEPHGWLGHIDGLAWNVPVRLESVQLQLRLAATTASRSGRCIVWVSRASTRQRVPIEFELQAVRQPLPRT